MKAAGNVAWMFTLPPLRGVKMASVFWRPTFDASLVFGTSIRPSEWAGLLRIHNELAGYSGGKY